MSAPKHVPMRRCVVCRTSMPKERLIRFVRTDDAGWQLDPRGRAEGRGTWVCMDCARAQNDKQFARGFRGRADTVVDQLREHLNPDSPKTGGNHG